MEVGRDQLGKLILEPLSGAVGEGQVVGVGAGGERALAAARAEQQCRDKNNGGPHLGAATAPHGLPPSDTVRSTLFPRRPMIVMVPDSPLTA